MAERDAAQIDRVTNAVDRWIRDGGGDYEELQEVVAGSLEQPKSEAAIETARWVQAVERLKSHGYTPWLSADEFQKIGTRDLLRELELVAAHLERLGY